MGLKLIHSNENREAKPRVFVVAEQSIFEMISQDLALEVYPVCFDYASFIQASLTKSISVNNAVVLISDSLSQSIAPLEAVIALTKENAILIPWQMGEQEVLSLEIAIASRRPTLNTLRRSIYNHIGLNEPPARFDGDKNIEAPKDASVLALGINELQNAKNRMSVLQSKVHNSNHYEVLRDDAIPQESPSQAPLLEEISKAQVELEPELDRLDENLEPIFEAELIDEEPELASQSDVELELEFEAELEPAAELEPEVEDELEVELKFQPGLDAEIETKIDHESSVSQETIVTSAPQSIYDSTDEKDDTFSAFFETPRNEVGLESIFDVPTSLAVPIDEATPVSSEYALPVVPSFKNQEIFEHPVDKNSTDDTFGAIFNSEQTAPPIAKSQTMFAFSNHDTNGNQNMWPMYESSDDLSDTKALSMHDFPDVLDDKKQISLKEPLVICVYSPKGGVGKTSISVNLAARLAYTTRAQVCIVDLDIGFGNVGTRLGLYNPTVRELLSESHLDSEALARNLVYDRRSGLFALLAPLRPETGTNRRKFSPATYNKILGLLTQRFDIVILDCPVELRDPLVSGFALTSADKIVMVVNNEQATLLDARRALEAMCRSKESQRLPGLGIDPKSIGLIVNQKVDNVGREVQDVIQVISGADQDHPSRQVDLLAVIDDDRELWVGNANMARTVATSGENPVDIRLDQVWAKLLPENVLKGLTANNDDGDATSESNKLEDILSNRNSKAKSKSKRRFSLRKDKGDK